MSEGFGRYLAMAINDQSKDLIFRALKLAERDAEIALLDAKKETKEILQYLEIGKNEN